jgi:hypothetical protein
MQIEAFYELLNKECWRMNDSTATIIDSVVGRKSSVKAKENIIYLTSMNLLVLTKTVFRMLFDIIAIAFRKYCSKSNDV